MKGDEITTLIHSTDLRTWYGRRDRTILLLFFQTGLRISELADLKNQSIEFGPTSIITFTAKGNVERKLPLREDVVQALEIWMSERKGNPDDYLFISNRKSKMSHDAIQQRVKVHMETAKRNDSSLNMKNITPHSLRHSTAMDILQNGGSRTSVTLWLGHKSEKSTSAYVHADIEMREKTMALTQPQEVSKDTEGQYSPSNETLKFLDNL